MAMRQRGEVAALTAALRARAARRRRGGGERLLDRLEDCRAHLPPRQRVLGGAAEAVVARMCGGRAGIERVVLLDSSAAMLERCKQAGGPGCCKHVTSPSHAVEM